MRFVILGLLAASAIIGTPASAALLVRGTRGTSAAEQFGVTTQPTITATGSLRGLRVRGGDTSSALLGGGRGGRLLNRGVTTTTGGSVTNAFSAAAIEAGVPEPSTWAMMLFGFGAIGFGLRQRKRGMSQMA